MFRYDNVPPEINRLRCRVNYHALKFLPEIEEMADSLASRMRNRTGSSNPYMYVTVAFKIMPLVQDLVKSNTNMTNKHYITGHFILGLRKGWLACPFVILWGQGRRKLKWQNTEKKNGHDGTR